MKYLELTDGNFREVMGTMLEAMNSQEDMRCIMGKPAVRIFAREYYGGSYTWRQLRDLFRQEIIIGSHSTYSAKII